MRSKKHMDVPSWSSEARQEAGSRSIKRWLSQKSSTWRTIGGIPNKYRFGGTKLRTRGTPKSKTPPGVHPIKMAINQYRILVLRQLHVVDENFKAVI